MKINGQHSIFYIRKCSCLKKKKKVLIENVLRSHFFKKKKYVEISQAHHEAIIHPESYSVILDDNKIRYVCRRWAFL